MVVTHPFHPLRGQCLEVLLERRRSPDRVFLCDAGGGVNVELAEDATDRVLSDTLGGDGEVVWRHSGW